MTVAVASPAVADAPVGASGMVIGVTAFEGADAGPVPAALVAVQWNTLVARLPEVGALVSAANLLWLLLVLAVTKVLHELAHALSCKHFGGECHEIGLMLLVFTPCLWGELD